MRIGLGAAATVLLMATPGHAFGLRTHLYIAEQVWNDLADCSVSVAGENVPVDQTLCRAIRNNKGAFLAGAIGPDAFPDLLIGQNYVHPGTPNGRQSADWLQIVLEAAETPEELAFAYGQLIHAAGDIFAHSYVNNYAGGVFELTARWHKDVEQRHFELEKYIDQRLPYEAPLDELVVPSNLLVRSMVRAPYIPGDITLTTGDLREFARGPGPASARAARLIGEKVGRAVPASHMTGMHVMLVVSDRAARRSVCDEVRAVYALADSYERYLRAEALARGAAPNWPARTSPVIADENCTAHELATAEAVLRAVDKLTADIPWHDGAMNARETWLRTLDLERRAELAAIWNRQKRESVPVRSRHSPRSGETTFSWLSRPICRLVSSQPAAWSKAASRCLRQFIFVAQRRSLTRPGGIVMGRSLRVIRQKPRVQDALASTRLASIRACQRPPCEPGWGATPAACCLRISTLSKRSKSSPPIFF